MSSQNLKKISASWAANEPTIIRWIIEGQFKRPLRVIAFNTEEGWSRDVTREIAEKMLDLNNAGTALGAAAREFVERVTGVKVRRLLFRRPCPDLQSTQIFGLALALVLPPFLYCLPSHIEFADSRVLQAISRRLAQCM
jgi:hypothetical protein